MVAKSIIEVPVNDAEFKAFVELFNDYRAKLKELPGDWGKVNQAAEAAGESVQELPKAIATASATSEDIVKNFTEMTAALMAQAELHRRMDAQERAADTKRKQERDVETTAQKNREQAQKRYEASVAKTNLHFKEMRTNIGGAVAGIASAATDVLKWVGLGGIASGLLGAGGLFGLDRLADSAGQSRRSAQGLDTSIGDLKAFSVNYQRVVDPGSYLSNIENVARTPGLQYGVGGNIAQMSAQGKDTADIGKALIPIIKQTFQQYGANSYALKASGLDNIVSLQEAIRISKLSDNEIGEIGGKYEKGKTGLALNDQVAKDWQDLSVQLSNAGERIENVLIKDLDKLAPVINHLSDEAVDLVDKWTKDLVPAIDQLATYLDSDDFKKDLKDGADAVKDFAEAAKEAAYSLGLISRPGTDPGATSVLGDAGRDLGLIDRTKPNPAVDSNRTILQWNIRNPNDQVPYGPGNPSDTTTPFERAHQRVADQQPFSWMDPGSWMSGDHLPGTAPWDRDHALGATEAPGSPEDWRKLHNPGDLFVPGSTSKMLGFGSDEDGLRGIDKQLMLYEKRDHLDTLEKIIREKYAPKGKGNDPEAYIRNLVARTGIARDQHLDAGDVMERAKIIAGITKREHSNTNYTPDSVRVIIQNNTGGSAVVSTSQLGR